jgi:hypothetical protein
LGDVEYGFLKFLTQLELLEEGLVFITLLEEDTQYGILSHGSVEFRLLW